MSQITQRDLAWYRLREHLADKEYIQISDLEDEDVSYHTARRVLCAAEELVNDNENPDNVCVREIRADGTHHFCFFN